MNDIIGNKYTLVFISFTIVATNILLDCFVVPCGITLTPIVIVVGTILINTLNAKFDLITRTILTFLVIALNDIGIKLYGGGSHDLEGIEFIHFFLALGLLPCFIILSICAFKNKEDGTLKRIGSLILFVMLICFHLYFFERLGLDTRYI
jgi:cytochrome bd-type quinol oxidase subunit 1